MDSIPVFFPADLDLRGYIYCDGNPLPRITYKKIQGRAGIIKSQFTTIKQEKRAGCNKWIVKEARAEIRTRVEGSTVP